MSLAHKVQIVGRRIDLQHTDVKATFTRARAEQARAKEATAKVVSPIRKRA